MQTALLSYLKDWMKNGEAARSEQINLVVAINLTDDRLYLADAPGDWYFRSNHLFEKLSKLREMMSKSPESTSASDLGGYIFELANAAFTLNVADPSLKDNAFLDIVCEKFSIKEQNEAPESYKFAKDIVKDNREIKAYLKSALEKAKEQLQARAAGPTDASENSASLAAPVPVQVPPPTLQPPLGEASVSVNTQKKKSGFVAPLAKKKKDDAPATATSKIIPEEPEEKPKTGKKGKDSAQPATSKVTEKSPAPQVPVKPVAPAPPVSTGVATRSAASKKAAPEKPVEAPPAPPAPEKTKDKPAGKSKDKPAAVPAPAPVPAVDPKKAAAEEKKKTFAVPVKKDETPAPKPAEPQEEKKPVSKSKDAKKGKDAKANASAPAPQPAAPQKRTQPEPAPVEQKPAPVEEEKKVQRKSAVRQPTTESREEVPVQSVKDSSKISAEESNPITSGSRNIKDTSAEDRAAEIQRRSERRLARTEPQEEPQAERLSFPKIESRTVLIPGMEAIVKQLQGVCEEPIASSSTGRNPKSGQPEQNKISLVSELKGYVQKLTELEELRRSALENLIRQIVNGDDEYQKDNQNLLVLLMKSGIVEIEERDTSINDLTKRYNASLDFQSKLKIETSLIKNELHENRDNLEKLERRYVEYKDAFRKISEELQNECAEREDISSRLHKLKQEYDPLKAKYDKIKSLVREWKNKVDVPEMSANVEDIEATGRARRTKNTEDAGREEFSKGGITAVRTSGRPESAQTGQLRKKSGWPSEGDMTKQKNYEEINDEDEVTDRPLGKRRVAPVPRPAEATRYAGGSSSYRPTR